MRLVDNCETSATSRLDAALSEGGCLEARDIDGVPLAPGELAYADLAVEGWRHYGLEGAVYERRTLLVGGPLLMAVAAIVSVSCNRRRRRAAERLAAPQWRPLGWLRVVVTSERLLVWQAHAWWSVWFGSIVDLHLQPDSSELDVFFADAPPYRLAGRGVAALAIVLAHHLFGENLVGLHGAREARR
jgi:hypothetical protein